MLYKIGDSRKFRYEAARRESGLAASISAVVKKPDGTNASLVATELDNGLVAISKGIYEVNVNFDQDGEWLMMFDVFIAGKRRPGAVQVTVNTALVNAIEKIASASEIEGEIASIHGAGSYETINGLPEVESTFSPCP